MQIMNEEQNEPTVSKEEAIKEAVRIGDEQLARGEYSSRSIDDIIADCETAVKQKD